MQWADISRLKIGDTASCELLVDERSLVAFAELSGDDNPLHMDENVARNLGFPCRVAHGMLALSAISRLIGTQLPGPGSLWISQELKFPAPVLVGDALLARVSVERVSLAAGLVKLQTEVRKRGSDTIVLSGTATVRIPHLQNPATTPHE
jgi:3-hydroxybutyryl-CoA dehydratase